MQMNWSIVRYQRMSQVIMIILLFAMLYSFFTITMSHIALLIIGLLYTYDHWKTRSWHWKTYGLMMLGFMPFLLGLFLSSDTSSALKEIQHNLGYLSLPIAMILLPRFSESQVWEVLLAFIILIVLSTVPVYVQYFTDFEQTTLSLGKGQAIQTPIDHVRYSIFLAIACVFAFIGFLKGYEIGTKQIRLYLGIAAGFLFIALHVFAVRSGILLSYVGIILTGIMLLIRARRWKWMILLIVIVVASPTIAYYSLPSFHTKVHYAMYDFRQGQLGDGANYSDSERFRSYRMGLEVWKDNWLLGAGTGDLQQDILEKYEINFPEGGRALMPHNQFLKFLASSGIVGLGLFLLSVYGAFFYSRKYLEPFALVLITMLTVSFLVEATFERSYMLSLYLLLATLLYQKLGSNEKEGKA